MHIRRTIPKKVHEHAIVIYSTYPVNIYLYVPTIHNYLVHEINCFLTVLYFVCAILDEQTFCNLNENDIIHGILALASLLRIS